MYNMSIILDGAVGVRTSVRVGSMSTRPIFWRIIPNGDGGGLLNRAHLKNGVWFDPSILRQASRERSAGLLTLRLRRFATKEAYFGRLWTRS